MEREQIKKALECCAVNEDCNGCPYYPKNYKGGCVSIVMKDALALINDLTEEKESCRKRIENQREEIRRLHNHIGSLEQSRNARKEKAERLGKQVKELIEKNERLNASCTELAQCCTKLETLYKIERKRVDTVKADTVLKIQLEIKSRCIEGGIYPAFVERTVDQIAKEMLEEDEGK